MKKKISFLIDGQELETEKGKTILEAALENNIYIPHLCFRPGFEPFGACRLCLVESGDNGFITACEIPVEEDMDIISDSDKLNKIRKIIISLLISEHEGDCLKCPKSGECKLQEVASYLGINDEDLMNLREIEAHEPLDDSNPFFLRDNRKCILCGLCVQACDLVGVNALDFVFRGSSTKIGTFMDRDIIDSNCVSCGECVTVCPVGALSAKSEKPSREVKTICPYCGVGCGIYLGIKGNRIVSVRGDPKNPVNKGQLCVKGRFALGFVNSPDRLKKPLIRENGTLREVGWDEAIAFIARKLSKYSGDDFATVASAKCTNEENYLLQKFTRMVMSSPNIDHCARLCHAPSLVGLRKTFGSGAMTNSINEFQGAGCILAIGTNTTETHPIIAYEIIKAVKKGSKLIVINPIKVPLARHADIYLRNKPGTDIYLIMAMCKIIIEKNLTNEDFIKKRTENFELFKKYLQGLDLKEIETVTGVNLTDIEKAAIVYASHSPSSIIYAMGITQHINGTDNVIAISNLALLTGNVGKPHAGVNPLRGQNNVQGASDMGALPDFYPGYQPIEDVKVRKKFEKKWNSKLPRERGRILKEIFDGAIKGEIKALYIIGENPILSEPDIKNVKRALENVEFLIVQDIFLTETAKFADVVLPACSFAEKKGTFTNTERRVQLIRSAVKPPRDAKPDWWIICKIAKEMGVHGFDFKDPEEIFNEIKELVPSYKGISYERLESGGVQWPCENLGDPGTAYLYEKEFTRENGKASFEVPTVRFDETPDEEYPFILLTGRILYQYHTMTMTGKVPGLGKFAGKNFIEMNPKDARSMDIREGDNVIIKSRRGLVKARVKFNEALMEKVAFMPFHFALSPANCLTNPEIDPLSGIPSLKMAAVDITPEV